MPGIDAIIGGTRGAVVRILSELKQNGVNKVTEQSDVNKVTNGRKYTPEGENVRK